MPIDVRALQATYSKAGQQHVFQFWDTLTPEQQATFASQLASIDPEHVNATYQTALSAPAPSASSSLVPPPASSLGSVLSADSSTKHDVETWSRTGLEAVKEGKVGVLLLAGGQGTRLGSSAPKGCYDVGLPSHKSLFQLQAERLKALHKLAGGVRKLPWYIMTSGPTREPTESFFKENSYFGLQAEDVIFFEQGVLPCLAKDGKFLLDTPSSLAVAPDGNGGVYSALIKPLSSTNPLTVLTHAASLGVEYLHAYCVDNSLVRIADPTFLGYNIFKQSLCGAKVVRKTDPKESVGVIAVKDGKFNVVEYSEIPEELSTMLDADSPKDKPQLAFRAANIVNHFYTLSFLNDITASLSQIPYHIASKKIPHVTASFSGGKAEYVKPTSPNGVKLELFIFDVFPYIPPSQFSILEVARSTDFSPLKNAPGTGSDDPGTSRRDVLAEARRWLEEAGAVLEEGVEVEIAPSVSLGGEGLESVQGKTLGKSGAVETLAELEALFV